MEGGELCCYCPVGICSDTIMHITQYILLSTFSCLKFKMKVVLKEIRVIRVFLWISFINYANYKCSHAVFYDLVSTCRLVVLKLLKRDRPHTSFR